MVNKEFYNQIKELIDSRINRKEPISIFQVKEVNKETYTANIKHLQLKKEYNDVRIIGTGLGNYKGVMKLPSEGDLVLCAFLDDDTDPIILGTLFDNFTTSQDGIPQIEEGEYLIANKTFGSILLMNKDNSIILTTGNQTGASFPKIKLDNINKEVIITTGGAKAKLQQSGGFKIFDNGNYGIQSDGNGNITIYGDTTFNGSVTDLKDSLNGTVVSQNPKSNGTF